MRCDCYKTVRPFTVRLKIIHKNCTLKVLLLWIETSSIYQVRNFKCLFWEESYRNNSDVEEETGPLFCGTTWRSLGANVFEETLSELYNVMVVPSLLHGCETWTLRAQQIRSKKEYPKVSGMAACSENCKWWSSLPLGAVVSLFCESV
jgi:hypothetical protein